MSLRILPSILINQIAAGEVIEKPSSVVKELVENAIDAGATKIEISLRDSGKSYLCVMDNGLGMNQKDLTLAVERHATSKLPEEDLFNITTLGFRGEALPSIAAVSRLCLTSRPSHQEEGWSLSVEGGKKYSPVPAFLPFGTKVEVRDLFFATPARLKFLKSTSAELSSIIDVLHRIALSHPSIAFKLNDEKRTLFDYPSTEKQLERVSLIMGEDFHKNSIEVYEEQQGLKLTGFIGLPTLNRANAQSQYLFVNNRPVRDKLLNTALRISFQDFLARERHPLAVLYLEIFPNDVDVNVHPAKIEVRFKNPVFVRNFLITSLKNALQSSANRSLTLLEQETTKIFRVDNPHTLSSTQKNHQTFLQRPTSSSQHSTMGRFSAPTSYFNFAREDGSPQQESQKVSSEEESLDHPPLKPEEYPRLGIARGQLHKIYIISETAQGFLLVDQHAAHERLTYEKMKKDMTDQGIKRQILLIPEFIQLTEKQVQYLSDHREELVTFGLVLEKVGDKNILVREVPALLGTFNIPELIQDLADEIEELESPIKLKEKVQEILSTFSCHTSIRAGKKMSLDEMNALLRQMEETAHSGQCNHGRPTYIELSKNEIEKLFGRKS